MNNLKRMRVSVVQDYYLEQAHLARVNKMINNVIYRQIVTLICSKDKEVIKLGAKKLNEHLWR